MTSLNQSMSMNSAPTSNPDWRPARASICSARSSISGRLGRPVNESYRFSTGSLLELDGAWGTRTRTSSGVRPPPSRKIRMPSSALNTQPTISSASAGPSLSTLAAVTAEKLWTVQPLGSDTVVLCEPGCALPLAKARVEEPVW